MKSNEKVAKINTKIKTFFFRYIELMTPFHKLAPRYQRILALLLYHHFQLQKEITNNKILWKVVFDYDTKILICDELGIQQSALENLYSQLRKKNVIVNNQISEVYIPNISLNAKTFNINFNFNIIDND